MSGTDFLADTNALIYLLSGNECMRPYLGARFFVSCITEMELLSYPDIKPADEAMAKELLACCAPVELSQEIKEGAIALRRQYRLRLPDAIVAASAQARQIPLLTADKVFLRVAAIETALLQPAAPSQ